MSEEPAGDDISCVCTRDVLLASNARGIVLYTLLWFVLSLGVLAPGHWEFIEGGPPSLLALGVLDN